MKTNYSAPEEYVCRIMDIEKETDATGKVRPERFIRVMRENRGSINMF